MTPTCKKRTEDSFDHVAEEEGEGECDGVRTHADAHQYNAGMPYWYTGKEERDEETLESLVRLADLGRATVKRASEKDQYWDVSGTRDYLPLASRQGQRLRHPRKSGILPDKQEGMASM